MICTTTIFALMWRQAINAFGFGPYCVSCGRSEHDVTIHLYEGRGGLFKRVWMCAPCNQNPLWRS